MKNLGLIIISFCFSIFVSTICVYWILQSVNGVLLFNIIYGSIVSFAINNFTNANEGLSRNTKYIDFIYWPLALIKLFSYAVLTLIEDK